MDKVRTAKKQKQAKGPNDRGMKDGPINQHKMMAMGCPIPDDRTSGKRPK